jgi:small subunit ribosomal protein S6e
MIFMAVFKFVIAQKGVCCQLEKDQKDCSAVTGLKIGSRFNADFLGLEGYELKVTGGSDKDGFPMNKTMEGSVKKRILAKEGHCFSGWKKAKKRNIKPEGLRKKKMMRGNVIDSSIVQVNCNVVQAGSKPLSEIVPKKEKKE